MKRPFCWNSFTEACGEGQLRPLSQDNCFIGNYVFHYLTVGVSKDPSLSPYALLSSLSHVFDGMTCFTPCSLFTILTHLVRSVQRKTVTSPFTKGEWDWSTVLWLIHRDKNASYWTSVTLLSCWLIPTADHDPPCPVERYVSWFLFMGFVLGVSLDSSAGVYTRTLSCRCSCNKRMCKYTHP